jgi:hypothetical protein
VGNLCYQEFSNNSNLSFVGNLCYLEFSNKHAKERLELLLISW